jgi:hypothetical protein
MPELVVSKQRVHTELDGARIAFHQLVAGATDSELRSASEGTCWTNEELLFHMLFGYLIARALLVLAGVFSRLPSGASRGFASVLNSATPLFDEVNYLGSCAGARVVGRRRMDAMLDRVIASLHRRLAAGTEADLRRGMHYPVRWDPFFKEFMTVADIYHYPTQHFGFHQRQLTLTGAREKES